MFELKDLRILSCEIGMVIIVSDTKMSDYPPLPPLLLHSEAVKNWSTVTLATHSASMWIGRIRASRFATLLVAGNKPRC